MCCSPLIVCRSHNSKRTGRQTFADTIPRIQGDRSIRSIFGKFFLHHGIRPWQHKISWQGSEVQEFILMIRWQYPPRQWPQVKSLTMVRKVAFGVGFVVLLILSVEVLSSFLVTVFSSSFISSSRSNFSACCMIFAGTDCLCFHKEKKYIRLNVCFAWSQWTIFFDLGGWVRCVSVYTVSLY